MTYNIIVNSTAVKWLEFLQPMLCCIRSHMWSQNHCISYGALASAHAAME